MDRVTFKAWKGRCVVLAALALGGAACAADRDMPAMTLGEPEISVEPMPTAHAPEKQPARATERRAARVPGKAAPAIRGVGEQPVDPAQWQKVQGLAQALLRAKLEEGGTPESVQMDAQISAARQAREQVDQERLRVSMAGSSISRGQGDPAPRATIAQGRTATNESALDKARARLAQVGTGQAHRPAGRVPTHVAYKAWEVHNEQARGEAKERSSSTDRAADADRPYIDVNPSPTIQTLIKPVPLPKNSR